MPIHPLAGSRGTRPGPYLSVALALGLMAGGCAVRNGPSQAPVWVDLAAPVSIPAGSAHARFQGGRQVAGASRLAVYCELEIETVSDQAQWAQAGRYPVLRQRFTLLKDPTTRIPALFTEFSCSDPLFQESFWRLGRASGGNLYALRCIRPFYNCAFAPPLRLGEVGTVTGDAIRIEGPDS